MNPIVLLQNLINRFQKLINDLNSKINSLSTSTSGRFEEKYFKGF